MTDAAIKTFRVEIKIRNNLLRQRREELGFATSAAFCEANGLPQSSYGELEAMKRSAISQSKGRIGWRKIALRLEQIHKVPVEDLFPAEVLAIQKTSAVALVDADDMMMLLSDGAHRLNPEQLVCGRQLSRDVDAALLSIPGRPARLIREHVMNGRTLEELGEAEGCGPERIRQIVAKGLRMMRHSSRVKLLKPHDGSSHDQE